MRSMPLARTATIPLNPNAFLMADLVPPTIQSAERNFRS